jgi:flagellin
MTAQIRGLDQASRNASDGIGMMLTAEGGLQSVNDKLIRIKELLVQGANDTYTPENRNLIDTEIQSLLEEINNVALRLEYNSMQLLNGMAMSPTNPVFTQALPPGWNPSSFNQPPSAADAEGPIYFQIGANSHQGVEFEINGVSTTLLAQAAIQALGIPSNALPPLNSTTQLDLVDILRISTTAANPAGLSGEEVSSRIQVVDAALEYVNTQRANLGSIQNRLEHTIQSLDVSSENLSDARSRIRDADMAKEMMDFMQMQTLFNAGMSMMAHGKQLPQNILGLLRDM